VASLRVGRITGGVDYSESEPRPLQTTFEDVGFASYGSFESCSLVNIQAAGLSATSIAGDVQLTNRDSICGVCGIDSALADLYSDTQLIVAAYRKVGESIASHLEGEFAFAIWDAERQRLFCCRDQLGLRSFYYRWERQRFFFGSTSLAILRNPGVTRSLNRTKLAAIGVVRGHHEFDEETFYCGIMSLRPGTCLTVDRHGIKKSVYWRPEVKPDLIPSSDDDAFVTLRDLLFRAVHNRLRNSRAVASFFSGGLDSSAITAIGAKCLEENNQELLAISAVVPDERAGAFTDERQYINLFRSFPNVRFQFITAGGRGPFDWIHDPSKFEDSFQRSSVSFLIDSLEDAAVAHGADVALTGNGGEFGVTHSGHGYALELAAKMQIGSLSRLSQDLRNVMGISPVRLLGREILSALFPLRSRRPMVYLAPGFRRESLVEARFDRTWRDHRDAQFSLLSYALRTHARPGPYRRGGRLRVSSPLYDRALIEFCMAAPGHMKIRHGYPRYMVRKALDGILPTQIQWRKDKLVASVDYPARFAAQVGVAREFVASIGVGDPVRSVVDVERLAKALCVPSHQTSMWEIPNTIYLICFLRQFSDFRI
jgi:asparagine synthase (glutamine-hydrolysing)